MTTPAVREMTPGGLLSSRLNGFGVHGLDVEGLGLKGLGFRF